MAIKSFADGFVKTARPIAQTIIRERSQPVHTQTYKPVPDGALIQSPPSPLIAMLTFGFGIDLPPPPGKAATYNVDGMTFQFPTGSDGYPSTAEEDLKKEGHYMKSLIALLSSGVDRVALPMTCLVQHLVRLQLLLTVRTTARDQQLGLLTLLSWTCAGFCSAGELKCALRPSGPGLRYSWAFHS
jgi:hypothetical protein